MSRSFGWVMRIDNFDAGFVVFIDGSRGCHRVVQFVEDRMEEDDRLGGGYSGKEFLQCWRGQLLIGFLTCKQWHHQLMK